MIDTAGIREATDVIEKIGVERTMEKIRQSAIVLYLFDVKTQTLNDLENDLTKLSLNNLSIIPIGNKIDSDKDDNYKTQFSSVQNILFISAKKETQLDNIKEKLINIVLQNDSLSNKTIVTNARHYEALLRANTALNYTLSSLDKKISSDLIALDIRRALDALGEITGDITTNDLLENIFSRFCIGK